MQQWVQNAIQSMQEREENNARHREQRLDEAIAGVVKDLVNKLGAETGRDSQDPEWQIFIEKATAAMKDTFIRGRRLEHNSASHPKLLYVAGNSWRIQREKQGMSIEEVAARSRLHWSDIALWEVGLIDARDREPTFLQGLATGYGMPELANAHRLVFGPP